MALNGGGFQVVSSASGFSRQSAQTLGWVAGKVGGILARQDGGR